MEFTGKIIAILPPKGGVSKSTGNEWKAQEYVIEEFDADAYTSVDIEMAPGGGFALMMYPESE